MAMTPAQFVVFALASGLAVGAMFHWGLPPAAPRQVGQTLVVGVVGAVIGGLLAAVLQLHGGLVALLQVLGAGAAIYVVEHRLPAGREASAEGSGGTEGA